MTDEATSQTSDARSSHRPWNWWLRGRSSRREYWLYIGLMFALGAILKTPPIGDFGMWLIALFVQIRRVHDFGRTGWWALAASVAPLLCVPLILITTEEIANIVGVAIGLVLVTGIGVPPGDAGENRFGPPPSVTVRRLLTGR
jgi:uncharacterized membrane protein YhaH (DUF805 family)